MQEINLNIRLTGELAAIVNEMLNRGYSTSGEDLVRASIISYGTHLGVISPKTLHKEVTRKMKASGRRYSDDEIAEQVERL